MTQEKLVLIGCDDTIVLSALLSSIRGGTFFPNQAISVTRVTDLIGIVKSLDPDLIILCFYNNQHVLNDLNSFAGKHSIPLLCLSRTFGSEMLRWLPDNVVFPYQLEQLNKQQNLVPVINSILNLRSEFGFKPATNGLTEAAIQSDRSDSNRNLSRYVMELDQKAEILLKIKDRIAELYQRVDDPTRIELLSIVNAIKMSSNNNKLWDDFKLYFEQTDPNFLLLLAQKYPDLTPIDLKYCCYIRMNMSNDDIGNLLGINLESVRTHKYRLKKKMSLAREQDLRNYLRSVNTKKHNPV
jgi:DNA-binding CsgD family transcriptional regulator